MLDKVAVPVMVKLLLFVGTTDAVVLVTTEVEFVTTTTRVLVVVGSGVYAVPVPSWTVVVTPVFA